MQAVEIGRRQAQRFRTSLSHTRTALAGEHATVAGRIEEADSARAALAGLHARIAEVLRERDGLGADLETLASADRHSSAADRARIEELERENSAVEAGSTGRSGVVGAGPTSRAGERRPGRG